MSRWLVKQSLRVPVMTNGRIRRLMGYLRHWRVCSIIPPLLRLGELENGTNTGTNTLLLAPRQMDPRKLMDGSFIPDKARLVSSWKRAKGMMHGRQGVTKSKITVEAGVISKKARKISGPLHFDGRGLGGKEPRSLQRPLPRKKNTRWTIQ